MTTQAPAKNGLDFELIQRQLIIPALSLCRRELVRFVRQRVRLIVAIGTPLLFWIVIGAGMGASFKTDAPGGGDFLQYFYPGTLVLILLFTAIFSTISIIEDRREGFLQSVLVAPVWRLAIVLGKVLGGAVLATAQGVLFLLLAPLAGVHLGVASFLAATAIMFLVSFALTGLGFCIAWKMNSSQSFHAVMNLFLMPMWLLSGAAFPESGARSILRWLMVLNPLTYGVSALRRSLYLGDPIVIPPPGWAASLGVSILFAAAMMLAAAKIVDARTTGDLH